jgi:hypothetical protein
MLNLLVSPHRMCRMFVHQSFGRGIANHDNVMHVQNSNIFSKLKLSKGKAHSIQLEFLDRYWSEVLKTQRREVLALPKAGLVEILQR